MTIKSNIVKKEERNINNMQKNVDGQCNDNKSSNRGERYQYAEQSCINDKRKKTVPSGY